jgi:4-hydroxybenzoate polyprenyltransferase
VTVLPFRKEFVDYLRTQQRQGRRLILVTASNEKFAREISDHLGLFDDVLASNTKVNLSGKKKSELLRSKFGDAGFDYAGNARIDLKIWRHARRAILVGSRPDVAMSAREITTIDRTFENQPRMAIDYLRAMRPHQWSKNFLLFVHLFAAHEWFNSQLIGQTAVAFISFSLCSSSVYLLNDLLDLDSDRHHPQKRFRPLAAASVPIGHAFTMIPVLLVGAFSTALFLPIEFLLVLAIYYAVTMAYSVRLKRITILDVLTLAGLYSLRIIAGASVVPEMPSFWLLALSMFLFFSLAIIKRYTELLAIAGKGLSSAKGRNYNVIDLETLISLGITSGYMSVLVLALYIDTPDADSAYTYHQVLWLLCPLLMYWLARIWLVTRRGQMHEDPLVYAIKDWRSRMVAVIGIIIVIIAA